ncbi:hypothetical protein AB9K35_04035 [Leisingera sp. XS_AS12]|uniref:hypothetical protein n=1 Tax=Leisingera sp. XS_AS12 TaxID=3241294 RepID=UPI0035168824
MKIHTKALLDTCGFACKSLASDPETGGYAELDARAVFITEDSVERARAAQVGLAPFDPSRLPSLRYGDILISRARPDGQKEGLHIPAGRDAGLVVPVTGSDGFDRQIPFTGRHMLSARQQLLAMGPRGRQLNADQRTILEGIQGVFEIVAAKADPAVFSEELIGQAFMCSLLDHAGRIGTSISDAEFGRKARADMIRAQITRVRPDHPDGLSAAAAADLDEVFQDIGIRTSAQSGGEIRSIGGMEVTDEALRGMIMSNERLSREVFGALTATPLSRLGAAAVSSMEYDLLADELSDRALTGQWVDRAQRRAQEITGEQMPGYTFEMKVFSVDGIDILAIRDSVGSASGQAFVYSWPTADRIPLAEIGNETVLNISPEEIPGEEEVKRLQGILDSLIGDQALEAAHGRAIRMA